MNGADWAIVAIVLISSLLSLKRGFVKEALSLGAWVAAFFIATAFSDRLATVLVAVIDNPSLRHVTSYAILFVGTLMMGTLISYLFAKVVKATGLSGADRLMGTVFGMVRGVVIVLVLIVVARALVPVEQEQLWQGSSLIPHFLLVENWFRDTFSQMFDLGAIVTGL